MKVIVYMRKTFEKEKHIPIKSVENDAFIIGLDRIYIAMIFPMIPNAETIDNNTPSIIKRNIITRFVLLI